MKRSLFYLCGLLICMLSSSAWSQDTDSKTPTKEKASKENKNLGNRVLVDTLDDKVPLEVGVQLRIFKQARGRKLEIDRLEGALERRRLRVRRMLEEVEQRYQALRVMQDELSAQLKSSKSVDPVKKRANDLKMKKERREQVARLSKVFNKMKADEAAKMIPVMDETLVVEVVSKLKPKQAASILGKLDAELAAKLTTRMAEAKDKN
ncbi:MAG: MotE family protein [Bradymonadia bacterium]